MTSQKLREQLKKKEYIIIKQIEIRKTGINWYAYKQLPNMSNCTHNDKPPGIIINPWEINTNDKPYRSVELIITGQILYEHWITINLYSVAWEELLPNLDLFERILKETWNSAATIKQESFSVVQEIDDEVA